MILSKQEILDEIVKNKLVEGFIDLKQQVQPASFDLTLDKVFEINSKGAIDFDNSERVISEANELEFNEAGWLELRPGGYKIRFNETIRLPANISALTTPRSSLPRCGGNVHVGWWDPGYNGKGECLLVIGEQGLRVKKNARLVQIIFMRMSAPSEELYTGIHQNAHL